jgi:tetratricopeptide (TPR) repeat protein
LADNGFACLDLEHYRQSFEIFQFLVNYHPNDPSFQAGLADSQSGLKHYLEAAAAYEETIRQAPEIPEAYVYLAEIYMMLTQHDHAQPLLEEVMRITEEGFEHPMRSAAERLLGYLREAMQGAN